MVHSSSFCDDSFVRPCLVSVLSLCRSRDAELTLDRQLGCAVEVIAVGGHWWVKVSILLPLAAWDVTKNGTTQPACSQVWFADIPRHRTTVLSSINLQHSFIHLRHPTSTFTVFQPNPVLLMGSKPAGDPSPSSVEPSNAAPRRIKGKRTRTGRSALSVTPQHLLTPDRMPHLPSAQSKSYFPYPLLFLDASALPVTKLMQR